jgi:hypothetical protein
VVVAGGPGRYDDRDAALWADLILRPTIAIPIPTTAASVKLLNRQCILDGWILRETTGAAPALVEFIDGADATGVIVGEAAIPAPSQISGLNVDTDVDAAVSVAAATATATLPGVAGQTTFITGFEITGLGATGALVVQATVTGVDATLPTYDITVPAGVGVAITPLIVQFARPIPATALNTAIAVSMPTFGAGNTAARIHAHGFQRLVAASGAAAGLITSGPGGLDKLLIKTGIFMRMISGSVTGAIWVKA